MSFLEVVLLSILTINLVLVFMYRNNLFEMFSHKPIQYITYNKGYYHVNWHKLRNHKTFKFTTEKLTQDCNDKDFVIEFKDKWFKQIYFRSPYSLLLLSNQLFTTNDLTQEDKDKIKKIVTISGILFNFKIPASLWIMDSECLVIAITYGIVCDRTIIDLDKIQYTTDKENIDFDKLLVHIPLIMLLVSKNTNLNRAPNITILCDAFKKTYPSIWDSLDKDIRNLKKLLTVCYYVARLDIPADYIEIDESVFKYLKGELVTSTTIKKPHLKLVHRN